MIKKINIGLDLDGVIIDHTQNKIKIAKSFGFDIKKEETQSEVLKTILPEDKYKKLQRIIYGKLTLNSPPINSSLKTLQKLTKDNNYNFFIISRRKKRKQDVISARRWLKKYQIFKIIPEENVFFVTEEKDKNIYCRKLKIKIYLDDKIKALKLISSVPFRIFFNPFKASNNEDFLEIKSWKEFPKLLKKIGA